MISEFNFELSTPVKYASGGEHIDGNFITLTAPSKKQMQHNIALKEAFFKAVNATSDSEAKEEKDPNRKLTGPDIIDLMYMGGIEMHKVLLSAIELFTSGVAKVEGSEKLTKPIIDEMTQDDLEAMTGDYMVNFTIASFLSRQESSKDTS